MLRWLSALDVIEPSALFPLPGFNYKTVYTNYCDIVMRSSTPPRGRD